MRYLLFLLLCLTGLVAAGQQASDYLAVVRVRGGTDREGNIVSYTYGKSVGIRDVEGTVTEIPWARIKTVEYRKQEKTAAGGSRSEPTRKWRHQITTTLDLARENQFFNFGGGFIESSRTTNLGLGVNYHLLRQSGHWSYGIGPGYNILTARRDESALTLTGLVDYALGNRRLRPTLRVEGGYALPIGNGSQSISKRRGGVLLFPSIGMELRPPSGRWGGLQLQLGYRFTEVGFTLLTPNLEIVDRRINYRRLVLSVGSRF